MALGAVKAVLFDLDGTLLNTLEDLTTSCNWALSQVGRPPKTLDEVRGYVGNGVGLLCERLVAPECEAALVEKVQRAFRAHYTEHMNVQTQPYSGIVPLLEALRERGVARAVISNKFDAATKAICRGYFGDLIDFAIGEGNGVEKKPCPEGVFRALRALNATAKEALYVGDSDVDVHTARRAGLPCVGVTWGFRGREVLFRAGADEIIDRPEELLRLL